MPLIQGFHFPTATTTQDTASPVGNAWTNDPNVKVTDGVVATATFAGYNGSATTDTLVASAFKFAIPASATITQIDITVKCRYTIAAGSLQSQTLQVFLSTAGVLYPFSSSTGAITLNVLTDTTLSLTGIALTNITPAIVNASTFGVNLSSVLVTNGVASATTEIDSVKVKITYTPAVEFPSTAGTLRALWMSDATVNLGSGTIATQINDQTGNAQNATLGTANQLADVKAATTANITLSGAQTIDGVSCGAGDRVLVKNQTLPAENGIYVVSAGAWTRATDADVWAEVVNAHCFVTSGSTNLSSAANGWRGWYCNVAAGGTIGVTAMTWIAYYRGAVYQPADSFGPERLVFSGDPTIETAGGGMPYWGGATETNISNYSATLAAVLAGSSDWSVVIWGRPRATSAVNTDGSSQKAMRLLFAFNDASEGHDIGFSRGQLEYRNPAKTQVFGGSPSGGGGACAVCTDGPTCFIVQGSGSNLDTYCNGRSTSGARNVVAGQNTTGFNIGSQNIVGASADNFFAGDIYGIAIFSGTALSAAERGAMLDFGAAKWGCRDGSESRIRVFTGDSITFGYKCTQHKNYPRRVAAANRTGLVNLARNGGWISTAVATNPTNLQITTATELTIRDQYKPATTGLPADIILFVGTNDIRVNANPPGAPDTTDDNTLTTTIQAAIASYVSTALSTGFNRVYVCTLIDAVGTLGADNATHVAATKARTRIDLLNGKIINGAGKYYVIPFHTIAELGPSGSSANTTYWLSDKTHPTDAGYALLAAMVQRKIGGSSRLPRLVGGGVS